MNGVMEKNIYIPVVVYDQLEIPIKNNKTLDYGFTAFESEKEAEIFIEKSKKKNKKLRDYEFQIFVYKRNC